MEFIDRTYDSILIRFGELGLKDSNRGFFERTLQENIQEGLHGLSTGSTERLQGGLKVHLKASSPLSDILNRLEKIPGIAWFAPCWETDRTPEAVSETVLNRMPDFPDTVRTFSVETQRSDKSLQQTSQDFNVEVGGAIDRETDLSVDLDNPDWSAHIHLLFERAYVFFHRREGFRGLPVGCSGSAISLLSGGIDSPVSSIQAFKRGLRLDFLHYYPYPTPEEALDQKMRSLLENIVEYGTHGKIYMLPYHEYDLQGPAASASDRDEIILFRRHMIRLANRIADRNDLKALVTGDSLGQVASQTLENIDTVSAASDRPILRPLIGLDKQEIIDRAQEYGTFEISTGPYQDCCSVRTKRVRTKSSRDRFRKLESDQDTDRLDRALLEAADVYKYSRGTLGKMADHDVIKSDRTNAESHGTPETLQ
jgi:thiamine biosynthesis protein ThiI